MLLARYPRVRLAHLPAALKPMTNLSRHLGGPTLWVKRDVCTGLGGGGNKVRKLEFLLGEPLAEARDAVLTCGALQSVLLPRGPGGVDRSTIQTFRPQLPQPVP